jgi:hypothetical protein
MGSILPQPLFQITFEISCQINFYRLPKNRHEQIRNSFSSVVPYPRITRENCTLLLFLISSCGMCSPGINWYSIHFSYNINSASLIIHYAKNNLNRTILVSMKVQFKKLIVSYNSTIGDYLQILIIFEKTLLISEKGILWYPSFHFDSHAGQLCRLSLFYLQNWRRPRRFYFIPHFYRY